MFSWHGAILFLVLPFLADCAMTFPEMVHESAEDPTYLLMGYGLFAAFVFIVCAVFGRRGLWWSVIDGVCAAGVLTLAISPLYGWLARSIVAGVLVGLTGLLSVVGPVILYRWAKARPIEDLFRNGDDKDDDH